MDETDSFYNGNITNGVNTNAPAASESNVRAISEIIQIASKQQQDD